MAPRPYRPHLAHLRWLLAGAAVVAVAGAWASCGRTAPAPLSPVDRPARAGRPVAAPPRATPAPAAGAGLEAACTVTRLVRFLDERRLVAARSLFAGDRAWPRRELVHVRHIDLVSARVWGDARADAVTLAATVRLSARPGGASRSGRTTLFFTLGRDRSAGDWLVTAVATSP